MSDAEAVARVFDALSSGTRVMVGLALLEGPKRLNELAKALKADPSNLRKVLLDMEEAGLVLREEGVWRATPLLASVLSSVYPVRGKEERPVPKFYIFIPSILVFVIAAVQAALQNKPTWLLGGTILAALLAIFGYLAGRGPRRP